MHMYVELFDSSTQSFPFTVRIFFRLLFLHTENLHHNLILFPERKKNYQCSINLRLYNQSIKEILTSVEQTNEFEEKLSLDPHSCLQSQQTISRVTSFVHSSFPKSRSIWSLLIEVVQTKKSTQKRKLFLFKMNT